VTEETQELAREKSVEGGIVTPGALIVGRFGARGRAKEGENVEAVVDTSLLHFFDPETGLGIYDASPTKGATS
jgi:multiple sugar transport system ATP-binding protein